MEIIVSYSQRHIMEIKWVMNAISCWLNLRASNKKVTGSNPTSSEQRTIITVPFT